MSEFGFLLTFVSKSKANSGIIVKYQRNIKFSTNFIMV